MEQSRKRPIEAWSDNEILEHYHSMTGALPGTGDRSTIDVSAITEEILRRGLPFPDRPAASPVTHSVDWSGNGGGQDPGSGALPNPV